MSASREELGVDDGDGRDFARDESFDVPGCELFDVFVGRFVAEVCVEGVVVEPGELECVGALFANDFEYVVLVCSQVFEGGTGDGAVVWATEPTVSRNHEDQFWCVWVRIAQQRVAFANAGFAEFGDEPEDGFGVWTRGDRSRLSACKLRGRNHLHRARNAFDVVDRVHPLLDILCITHGQRW